MKKYLFPIFSFAILWASCAGDGPSKAKLSSRSLLEYGVPITIMAPDSTEVETMDFKVTKDISLKGPDGYFVQIFASEASTQRSDQIKQEQLAEVRSNPYFTRLVKEEPDGFIFETMVDSTRQNFDFRYVQIKGDWEYIFRRGLSGRFTLEQVEMMYDAVKPVVE
ncbi:MAG: hypothetical protein AAFV25_16025 [Bacteroidota bacterium]